MRTRFRLQHRVKEANRLTAKIQPRPFSEPDSDQTPHASQDFSHVDLFSHAPVRRPIQVQLGVGGAQAIQRRAHAIQQLPPDAALIQCVFADGSYVGAYDRSYVQVIETATDPEGFVLLRDLKSGSTRIIEYSNKQYQGFMSSPTMSDYETTKFQGAVYRVRIFEGSSQTELIREQDLKDVPHLSWAMTTAQNDVQMARDIIAFLNKYPDPPHLSLAQALLIDENLNTANAEAKLNRLQPFLTLAQGLTIQQARDILTFLDKYADPTYSGLAHDLLIDEKLDIVNAEAKLNRLQPFLTLGLGLTIQQARDILTFLDKYADPTYSGLAHDLLIEAKLDTSNAEARVEFLKPYLDQTPEMLQIARREITAAQGNQQQAQARMDSFAPLFAWSQQAAAAGAETAFDAAKQAAADTFEKAKKEAQAEAKISATLMGKIESHKKINPQDVPKKKKYDAAVAPAKVIKDQQEQQAEAAKQAQESQLLSANQQFVADMTDNNLDGSVITLLMQLTQNDQKAVRALRQVLLAQANPADLGLVQSIVSTKHDTAGLATACEQLLTSGIAEDKVLILAKFNQDIGHSASQTWMTQQAATCSLGSLKADTQFLLDHKNSAQVALTALQALGNTSDLLDLVPFFNAPATVTWLLGYHGLPAYSRLVNLFKFKKPNLTAVQDAIAYNTANQNFPLLSCVDWIDEKGPVRVLECLKQQHGGNWDQSETLITLMLRWDVLPSSTPQFIALIRLDALAKTTGLVMTVYQADRNYAGSHDPPSRTGFVEYTFANGDWADIHTHWNTSKKKISSMHIQDGSVNGVEINQWKQFGDVQQAILTAHNASAAYPPRTNPPGGTLTL